MLDDSAFTSRPVFVTFFKPGTSGRGSRRFMYAPGIRCEPDVSGSISSLESDAS